MPEFQRRSTIFVERDSRRYVRDGAKISTLYGTGRFGVAIQVFQDGLEGIAEE